MIEAYRNNAANDPGPAPGWRRPPGALPEALLRDRCTGCGDCASVCPARAISLGPERRPRLTAPDRCASCGLCADVCTRGAIGFTSRMRMGFLRVLADERRSDAAEYVHDGGAWGMG
jgi:ferredoxin